MIRTNQKVIYLDQLKEIGTTSRGNTIFEVPYPDVANWIVELNLGAFCIKSYDPLETSKQVVEEALYRDFGCSSNPLIAKRISLDSAGVIKLCIFFCPTFYDRRTA